MSDRADASFAAVTHVAAATAWDAALASGGALAIEDDAYHHLFRARRLAQGDSLRVVDGRGAARWATIVSIDRRRAVAQLGDAAPTGESAYALHLAVAPLRPERASWLVEKATELGVAGVHFVATARTPRQLRPASLARLTRVADAAVAQSHRARRPSLTGVWSWREAPDALADRLAADGAASPDDADALMLDVPDAASPADAVRPDVPLFTGSVGIAWIGPEGGWTDDERAALRARGARPLALGASVLRVETAALAVAALALRAAGPAAVGA
ncbi:MAG: RsmE family RNA methyltransferase [Acidobacteriota bacterium]